MKQWQHTLVWVPVFALMVGCPKPAQEPSPPPGPDPLRSDGHMQWFLTSADAWGLEDGSAQYWQFTGDGHFLAWIEGPSQRDLQSLFSRTIPKGTRRLEGQWEATMTELSLRNTKTSSGQAVPDVSLPLRWVDGKLYLEIGGYRYVGTAQPPPENGPGKAG